ncbi:hypothetical protein IG631_11981 [Alternaria alternata]|nr:hypothetical protein IG631_11981 [Alternaria alternata]
MPRSFENILTPVSATLVDKGLGGVQVLYCYGKVEDGEVGLSA